MNKQEEEYKKLLEEVKGISKVSSFGAKKGNRYWVRMDKCNEIINKLQEIKSK